MLGLVLLGTGGAVLSAATPPLPPLSGELSGDFTPVVLTGAPKLHWTLTLRNPSAAVHTAHLSVKGADVEGEFELEIDPAGEIRWRLVKGRTALKPWFEGAFSVGTATVMGQGKWRDGKVEGTVTLAVSELDLGEVLRFADAEQKYVRMAEGRIEGQVVVQLREGTAEQFEATLGLVPGTIGLIAFRPSPGLLTSYVPEAVRKHYPGLEAIELGKTPLEAKVLHLTTHPAGDKQGRSARVRVEGRPRDPQFIAPLELDVNVTGPVESLLRKAMDSRFRMSGPK